MTTAPTIARTMVRIEILQVPDCPLVDQLHATVDDCLRRTGIGAVVETLTGPYPSPTLLIDGIDVATGQRLSGHACCRLDLPTPDQIIAALQKGDAAVNSYNHEDHEERGCDS